MQATLPLYTLILIVITLMNCSNSIVDRMWLQLYSVHSSLYKSSLIEWLIWIVNIVIIVYWLLLLVLLLVLLLLLLVLLFVLLFMFPDTIHLIMQWNLLMITSIQHFGNQPLVNRLPLWLLHSLSWLLVYQKY